MSDPKRELEGALLKDRFSTLEEIAGELDEEKLEIERRIRQVSHQMTKIEETWKKLGNECSCGLLGLSSPCIHQDDSFG